MRATTLATAHDVRRCWFFFQDNLEPIALILGADRAPEWEMDAANSLHIRKIIANVGGQQIEVVTYTPSTVTDMPRVPRIHVQAVVGPLRSLVGREGSQSSRVWLKDPTTVVYGVIPSRSDMASFVIGWSNWRNH